MFGCILQNCDNLKKKNINKRYKFLEVVMFPQEPLHLRIFSHDFLLVDLKQTAGVRDVKIETHERHKGSASSVSPEVSHPHKRQKLDTWPKDKSVRWSFTLTVMILVLQ